MSRLSVYGGQRDSYASSDGGGDSFARAMELGDRWKNDRLKDGKGGLKEAIGTGFDKLKDKFKGMEEGSRDGMTVTYDNPEREKVARGRHGYDQSVPETITAEVAGPMPAVRKEFRGNYKGIDFLQDDKGLFQGGKYAGPSMKEAFGNVRKYFGDKLNNIGKQNALVSGDGNVTNTAVQTANPVAVNANTEGLTSAQQSMQKFRDKNWDPTKESWYTEELGQEYGWDGGKYGDMPPQRKGLLGALLGT